MDHAGDLPSLDQLWTIQYNGNIVCFACGQDLGDEVLIRSFRPIQKHLTRELPPCSRIINGLNYDFLIFDRHHRCIKARTITAISHAWNGAVSDANRAGEAASPQLQRQVSAIIFNSLDRISKGLFPHVEDGSEIWYDYISVPQWVKKIKDNIIRVIPDLFCNAKFTLVHLHDVGTDAVHLLRHSTSTRDRINGVTSICNARWYARVWTAMEFIRSSDVKVMMREGTLIEDAPYVFLGKTQAVWDEERKNFERVQDLERFAEIGKNMVPWNLGMLIDAKKRGTIDFANAFAILARRGCFSDMDFAHALLGIVKADLKDVEIEKDRRKAMLQIAVACMKKGDYSPLLINPRSDGVTEAELPPILKISGYLDVMAFGLGNRHGFPEHHLDSTFSDDQCNIKLEVVGEVTFASQMHHLADRNMCRFLQCAMFALDHTGPNVPQFIETVAGRIYNFHRHDLDALLADFFVCRKIQDILDGWYNSTTRFAMVHMETAQRLVDLMGLTRILKHTHPFNTPLGYLDEHGGGIHGYSPASLIAARCPGCNKSFVYQVGLHRPPSEVRGSVAYRLTGIFYEFGKPDGAGILVKNGRIVATMVWATRACDCRVVDVVDVKLENLPTRIPRQ
ncbi:unnamed protein product [Periconia digitata]|uniref:Heterokaryon incompatibility domain-containing protein n=1 Tax=Periconia digitata TaxID=1303443 RepID=A0A9W4U394_9PLEO|nr:unnamed protein product [Periconia digitata]